METNYIALSVPVFFLLIAIEVGYSWYRQLNLYRISDAITNISCGIGQQLTGIIFKTILFYGYFWLYDHARLFNIPNTWYWWIILFVGVDFCYYWFHRLSHDVNAIWATHVVHHQSEDYNLTVALRQSWFQGFFSSLFYLPLALIGFEPLITITVIAFNTLYQFWIHTELIRSMGWFEWLFNTPSHHRVHHGTNPEYIDKNHGGTLIIWDRLFGTFQKEEAPVVYGITTPLNSWNPLWANFHYWKFLFQQLIKTPRLKDRLNVLLARPGWSPETNQVTLPNFNPHPIKFNSAISKLGFIYVLSQFSLVLIVASITLFAAGNQPIGELIPFITWSILGITSIGLYVENAKSAQILEIVRIFSLPVILYIKLKLFSLSFALLVCFCVVSTLLLLRAKSSNKKN